MKPGPGRPSKFTPELAETICELLTDGMSLRQIAALPGMPDRGTVVRWMLNDDGFAEMVARARAGQADLMDDRILDVAEKVERGELEPHGGRVVISAFQWRAEKLKPRRYGSKLDVTTHDADLDLDSAQIAAKLAGLLQRMGVSAEGIEALTGQTIEGEAEELEHAQLPAPTCPRR